METSVTVPWRLELAGNVDLKLQKLSFLFERWGQAKRFHARAELELGGLRFDLSGEYDSTNGWSFRGATYPGDKLEVGAFVSKLVAELGAGTAVPPALAGASLRDVAFTFDTKTKALEFAVRTVFPLGETALDAVVTIRKGDATLSFGGSISVGGAEFNLDFSANTQGKELRATWKTGDSGRLDLQAIRGDLPDLAAVEALLIPESGTLKLELGDGKRSLLLDCVHESGARAAFLLAQDSGGTWLSALGVKPGRISTDSLGPLGTALGPHAIALGDLLLVAASADAPKGVKLPFEGRDFPIGKGLLLRGALEFEGTSFSHAFECRLGESHPPSASLAGESGETTPAAAPPPLSSGRGGAERGEGANNVALACTIGPLTFRKARLEARDKRIYVLLDASLGSGGFALELTGFNLNFPLALLADPSAHAREIEVGLEGLNISYRKPPLTIVGGFARAPREEPYAELYRGHLLIKAETLQVTVLGSYGTIPVPLGARTELHPSLWLYGAYDGVLGGPAAFYVTGLALGGGYNTRLALPPVENVAEFPLVQAVTDPGKFTDGRLRTAVQPSYGDCWLAAGVKFESFKMADSFALLSVSFGTRLQFALLGLTKLTVPSGAAEDKCAAHAELAIRAVLDPEAGLFSAEGRLTERSFVFSKELRLSGGFAFFVWFGKAKNAGDFVISLGGYHPAFLPPAHYPLVPRVAIRGQIEALTIAGEAYLALTPSCLMAGLKLEAVFHSGRVVATFVAFADFLLAWAPFHYDASIGVGMSVTVRLWRTFKLEVSASLHVWGPKLSGTARVSLWIVSFTVAFGDRSGARPQPLTWPEFRQAFLPAPAREPEDGAFSTIRITEGLVREVKKGEVTHRIVNPHELRIETDSVVPCSEARFGSNAGRSTQSLGVRPMGATELFSLHAVSIEAGHDAFAVQGKFDVEWSRKDFPEALWSATPATARPAAAMLKDVLSGVVLRVRPTTPEKTHRLGPFLIEKFRYEPIDKNIPWQTPPLPREVEASFSGVLEVNPLRSRIRDCLTRRAAESGKPPCNEIFLKQTADSPQERFRAPPSCASLGQSL